MSTSIQITLRPGARIYINGAVVQAKRKATLEFLNDVSFLLDSHVLQVDETTTSLRQLYFVLQTVLIDPKNAEATLQLFEVIHQSTLGAFSNADVVVGLEKVKELVDGRRYFDGLRALRDLFAVEDEILAAARSSGGREPATETDRAA